MVLQLATVSKGQVSERYYWRNNQQATGEKPANDHDNVSYRFRFRTI